MVRARSREAQESKPDDDPKMFRRFKVVRALFNHSQVSGEGEPPPYEPPQWDTQRALGSLAINEVPFESYSGITMAYSYGKNIAVSPVAPYPFKTRVHEIAHVDLGHAETLQADDQTDTHRGIREFQAESTSYLTLHQLGARDQMDADESRAYVQGWMHGETPGEQEIRAVFSSTDRIVRAGKPEE